MPVRSRESQTLVLVVPRRGADAGLGSRQAVTADAQVTHSPRRLNRIMLPAGHTAATARQAGRPGRYAAPASRRHQEGTQSRQQIEAEYAASAARPWPSVKQPTVRTDRPSGPDAVRYTSVDTATHRLTVTNRDTGRDKKETARLAENSQLAGRFRRWWQVLGSNQRRLSRRFYSTLLPAPPHCH